MLIILPLYCAPFGVVAVRTREVVPALVQVTPLATKKGSMLISAKRAVPNAAAESAAVV